jgi:3-hydroxyisobutyrate dehydrogenase-like beta-hydroxyacid dehydrogenase
VSGGPVRSADGTLTIMVGGEVKAVEAAMPVLNQLGKHIVHIGGPGMGNVAKLVNNMVTLTNILTVGEALVLATKAGIPAKQMTEILTTGTAQSYALSRVSPKILKNDFEPGMTLTLALKDIGLALKLGEDVGLPLRVAAVTERLIKVAIDAGYSEKDVSFMHEAVKLAVK